jgi:hypothetical protein
MYNREVMITPYSHVSAVALAKAESKFVEKILTSANGERFRVLFLVTLVNGEVKAQIVSAKPILARPTLAIGSSDTIKEKHNTEYIPSNIPEVSPYFLLEFLINSQPTRAPSYK